MFSFRSARRHPDGDNDKFAVISSPAHVSLQQLRRLRRQIIRTSPAFARAAPKPSASRGSRRIRSSIDAISIRVGTESTRIDAELLWPRNSLLVSMLGEATTKILFYATENAPERPIKINYFRNSLCCARKSAEFQLKSGLEPPQGLDTRRFRETLTTRKWLKSRRVSSRSLRNHIEATRKLLPTIEV